MLSGVKFIPRDELKSVSTVEQDSNSHSSRKDWKKSRSRKHKNRSKSRTTYSGSSDDEGTEKLKRRSKRRKWSSSEYSSSSLSESDSGSLSDHDEDTHRKQKTSRRNKREKDESDGSSGDKCRKKPKKSSKRRKKHDSSGDYSSSSSESDGGFCSGKGGHKGGEPRQSRSEQGGMNAGDKDLSDDGRDLGFSGDTQLARKEMGLEWMLKPLNQAARKPKNTDDPPVESQVKKLNPRELNPYLKDDGTGYPEDAPETIGKEDHLLPSSLVGDGGASWRLKALKRAREQATREGRKLDEVIEERWGSLGQLAVSVASGAAAPVHAHLHASRGRKRQQTENSEIFSNDQMKKGLEQEHGDKGGYSCDFPSRRSQMKAPKVHDSLSWRKGKPRKMSIEDSHLISEAAANLNKFSNDGSFLHSFDLQGKHDGSAGCSSEVIVQTNDPPESSRSILSNEERSVNKQVLTGNQLAAKVLQLRMKGKHDEAEKLLKESEGAAVERKDRAKATDEDAIIWYGGREKYNRQKQEDDGDRHLAKTIVQNKQYSISGRADDEYDLDAAPRRKQKKKGGSLENKPEKNIIPKRFLTQQERCQFCFENPTRPKHLVVSIGNFTYLMLPPWRPVVQGHCCILTLQHESSTRSVDANVWDEIRNFKKCLIKMFATQDKQVVFLETVMGLAKQRRHCLVECIPLPHEKFKQAPLYFKKAIDEAEDEWSQHNAKRLIDTSKKGLRGSIPKDFPYFYVEFGLDRGFVHVIDDEREFKSNLGLNVIRGMLQLAEEDMYRRQQHDSVEIQKQAVACFAREWEPFDWTKQLQ